MVSYSSLVKWWEAGKREIQRITRELWVRQANETWACRDLLSCLADHLKLWFDEGLILAYVPNLVPRVFSLSKMAVTGEDPGTQRTKMITDWCIPLRVHTCAIIGEADVETKLKIKAKHSVAILSHF